MATKHKAATDITIASTEEESALRSFVERYWMLGTLAAIALAGILLVRDYMGEQSETSQLENWSAFTAEVELGLGGLNPPSAATLGNLAEELGDGPAAPWAQVVQVGKQLQEEDLEGARQTLQQLETAYPDHPVVSGRFYKVPGTEEPLTLRDYIEASHEARIAWERDNAQLFQNPPLPDDAPQVRFKTSAGDILIGLYEDYAPKHTDNFLKLCREGFYDGILFHRVVKDFMIQAGDPNSRDADARDTWGQGGPGYTIDPEMGELFHFPGAVSAAATRAGGPTSGSQFFIVTGEDRHDLDGSYTVFGVLLEGEAAVSTIEDGVVLGETPEEPFVIESTEIVRDTTRAPAEPEGEAETSAPSDD